MFFGRQFPYSNLHDLNLDWIISEISSLKEADAEALAAILEQGVSGDSFKWRAQENTLIVTDNYDAELYRVIWDENGFTMSRGGGTPVTYRVANGTLTAPTINATALRAGSANVTGTVVAGEIHSTTPVAVQYGGTGADNAADARANLGAMADGTVPISKGGTGATSATAARTALNAVSKSGDTMTGDLTISKSIPAVHLNGGASSCSIMQLPNRALALRQYSPNGTIYHEYMTPAVDNTDTNASYTIMTTSAPTLTITADNNASISDNVSKRCGPFTMLACRITLPADTSGWTVIANFAASAAGSITIYDRAVTAAGGVAPLRFTNGSIAVYMSSGLSGQQILINRTMIM